MTDFVGITKSPLSALIVPVSRFSSVVLPVPLGPNSPIFFPDLIFQFKSLKSCLVPSDKFMFFSSIKIFFYKSYNYTRKYIKTGLILHIILKSNNYKYNLYK